MTGEKTARTCAQCGTSLAVDSQIGLCPRCVFQSVLDMKVDGRAPADSDSTVIRHFGDYELLERIAHGGMGVVYKARQISLQRTVALKMLLAGHFASREFIQRFQVEAAAAAGLQHPNIVAIHEVGEHDGQHYFSMDYVAGSDLAALTRNQPLSAAKAAGYVRTMAEAIHYAHERGILHRDLKPSNVLIDQFDQPRITDFGLAKRLTNSEHDTPNLDLTLTGQMLGSPGYMAPEQASGKRSAVGVPSDVYSLGAILYHLLTGRAPFCAESVEETLNQLLNNDPVSPRVLNSGVPRDLETICLKCLAKEPERRYQTGQELADELGRFLRREPILARPASALEKMGQWCRRRPAITALLATVVLLLVALAVGSTVAAFRIKQAELAATEKLREALVAEAAARRVSARPGQRFESLDALRRASSLNPAPELRYRIRNEIIASLARPDVRLVRARPTAPTPPALVEWLRFNRDMTLYAKINAGRDLTVFRATDDAEVAVLPLHGRSLFWIHDFSPDGQLLALEVSGGNLQIWDFTNRVLRFKAKVGVGGSDFSPDSRRLSLITTQETVSIYDLQSGELLQEIADARVTGHARFDPSGTRVVLFNSHTSAVEIRDAETGSVVRSLPYARASSDFGWSADGNMVAATGTDGNVRVWNAQTGSLRFVLEGHDSRAVRVSFSHNGRLIATTSWDNTIRLWDNQNGKPVLTYPGTSYQLHFSPDDRYLAFACSDDMFGLIEIAHHPEFTAFVPEQKSSDSFSSTFSSDGRVLVNTVKNFVQLWDVRTGQALGIVREPFCRTILFTPDGTNLLACGMRGLASWPIDIQQSTNGLAVTIGERVEILPAQTLLDVTMTPDGETLAVVNRDTGEARVFPADAPEKAVVCAPHRWVQFAAISPDGRWLATGTWNGRGVKIWDARDGRLLRELPSSPKTLVEFSPDGRWLLTAGEQYQIWRTGSWKEGAALTSSRRNVPIGYAAFSPDARMLALVRGGRELELLDISNARFPLPVAVLTTPSLTRLTAPHFSLDGMLLAAVGGSGEAFVWNLALIRQQLSAFGVDWTLASPSALPTREVP